MQTQELILKLQPSKIPLIAVILIFIFASVAIYYLPWLKVNIWIIMATMSICWLYRYLTYPYHQIKINTKSTLIQIYLQNYPSKSVTVNQFFVNSVAWWLTIIRFTIIINHKSKTFIVPVFMDSIPLKQYKSFRIFTLWQ